jgi:wyosine [tRNA(Phe)-imidazoG37] synthetase (radical SAM superfamily)
MTRYLFGPVNSRRLGLSQGIDLLPGKICNFNCVYCEAGAKRLLTSERKEYFPTGEIIEEIDRLLADSASPVPDVFTITATGEPTLHTGIGAIIRRLKNQSDKPVAVLTNGSLLYLPEVRNDLAAADIVIPSLDAARPSSYRQVNRPVRGADLETIIEGLILFRKEFAGEIWLEILLVKHLNDSAEDMDALQKAIARIRPDRIQLNTVVRPPLESYAQPIEQQELKSLAARFTERVEIPIDFAPRTKSGHRISSEEEILEMLKRRPCTLSDICEALNLDGEKTRTVLATLAMAGRLSVCRHRQREYFQVNPNGQSPTGESPDSGTGGIDDEQAVASAGARHRMTPQRVGPV